MNTAYSALAYAFNVALPTQPTCPSAIGGKVPSLALPDAASGLTSISLFETGGLVPASGVYAIIRSVHRLPCAVFLSVGQKFPGCSLCTESVQFWLLQQVDAPAGVDVSLRTLPVFGSAPG